MADDGQARANGLTNPATSVLKDMLAAMLAAQRQHGQDRLLRLPGWSEASRPESERERVMACVALACACELSSWHSHLSFFRGMGPGYSGAFPPWVPVV